MKHRHYTFGLAFLLYSLVTAAALGTKSHSPVVYGRTPGLAGTASPTQDVVNPAFVVTEDQVRKAFDEAELRGENNQTISVGEEHSANVVAQNPLGGTENLKLSVLFLSPLDQARAKGYEFGLVAKNRTPADRKDFEDRAVTTTTAGSNEVRFRLFLQQPKNADANIPSITFELVNQDGKRIAPTTLPGSMAAAPKDLIGSIALALEGEPLAFPLFDGAVPSLTSKMKKMTLAVAIDGAAQNPEYRLQ